MSVDIPAWAAQVPIIVQAGCKRCRVLQPHSHQLTMDLLLVLCGARPAVLLDYAPGLNMTDVLHLLATLTAACGCPHCSLLYLDGCYLIANTNSLVSHLTNITSQYSSSSSRQESMQNDDAGNVWLISFAVIAQDDNCHAVRASTEATVMHGGLIANKRRAKAKHAFGTASTPAALQPKLATPEEFQAFLPGLHALLEALQTQASSSKASIPTAQSVNVIDMAQVPGLPLMPTLFGILLGYPAVYLVEGGQEGAQKASRALSNCQLQRVRLYVHTPTWVTSAFKSLLDGYNTQAEQVASGGGRRGKSKGVVVNGMMKDEDEHLKGHVIASMTVPAHLLKMPDRMHDEHPLKTIPDCDLLQTTMPACNQQGHEHAPDTSKHATSIQELVDAWHTRVSSALQTHAALCWPAVLLEQVHVDAGQGVSL